MRWPSSRGSIGTIVVVGFFVALWWVVGLKSENPMKDAFLLLLGHLGAKFSTVVDWHFGSSAGSAQKTELLSKVQPVDPAHDGHQPGERK